MSNSNVNDGVHTKYNKALENSGMRSFVAGLSAGMASTVAGYVPDTIKVRLQTQPLTEPVRYKGAVDCAFRMVKEEGVRSLFRGMSTPLMSRAIVNGMCFSTYTLLMKGLYPPYPQYDQDNRSSLPTPSLPVVFLAGGCAGAASALVASPTELIKVQMQLGIVVGGPLHHVRALINHSGVRGLLLLGMLPTVLRDFVCMGSFFTTTNVFSRQIAERYHPAPGITHVAALLGGALAGVIGWALCYPFDVWKSNVQQLFGIPKNTTSMQAMSFRTFFQERFTSALLSKLNIDHLFVLGIRCEEYGDSILGLAQHCSVPYLSMLQNFLHLTSLFAFFSTLTS